MKKAIILVMSCNQDRYINEEYVIRKTWGKDIIEGKYENIKLYFYRGGFDKVYFDDENKVINLTNTDDLNGTYHKTLEVFEYIIEKCKDFDYIIRTNTSTYINVEAILQFLEIDDLKDDVMYGTRLLINNTNLNVPFLGGHFMIIPKKICNILLNSDIKPKCPDDLSIGYVLGKHYNYNYLSHLLEVDSIINIDEPYNDKLYKSYCIRIKDEINNENNIINMIGFHTLYKNITVKVDKPHGFTKIETLYGKIPI